jgi:hypothetical protein
VIQTIVEAFWYCLGHLVFSLASFHDLLYLSSDSLRPPHLYTDLSRFRTFASDVEVDEVGLSVVVSSASQIYDPARGSIVGGDIELFISHNRYEPDLNPHLHRQHFFSPHPTYNPLAQKDPQKYNKNTKEDSLHNTFLLRSTRDSSSPFSLPETLELKLIESRSVFV